MDELVAHCLREIAFDGDLGCDIPRLRTFASSFFEQRNQPQNIDASYFAFLWTVLVSQPSVRVGTVPLEAIGTEVWVAPQPKKKKDRTTTPVDVEDKDKDEVKLKVVDKTKQLRELEEMYGDGGGLRVAVDPETIFVALTGSHIRPTKLTGTVYTALQLITRGRAEGLSVVDLGKKTGYDQKACWYLVRQLVDLGLVVKLRRAGVGANFCIHRHFFERDAQWQGIQAETLASTSTSAAPSTSLPTPTPAPDAKDEDDEDYQPDAEAVAPPTDVTFDPIDARHLSSLALVKARIVKLLKSAQGNVYPAQNLIVTIGFTNPTKTERRFFQTRLRELMEQGVIERCTVPHPNPRRSKYKIPSIRLLDPDAGPDGDADDAAVDEEEEPGTGRFKATVTLHKQILDLLDAAGGAGMTLNDIVSALGNFDRRTLELILSRADRTSPPSHLADLRVSQMLETHGKERRYRFYTLRHYAAVVAREGLDDSRGPYAGATEELEGAGGFMECRGEEFYEGEEELRGFVDEFTGEDAKGRARQKRGKAREEGEGPKKRGRKRKRADTVYDENPGAAGEGGAEEDVDEPPAKKKRGRPPKPKAEPGASAAPKKRGRPPKKAPVEPEPADVAESAPTAGPSNAEAGPSNVLPDPTNAKSAPSTPSISAPSNAQASSSTAPTDPAPSTSVIAAASTSTTEPPTSTTTPKKRGRPRKHPLPAPTLDEHGNPVEPPPKKRGRPRKHPLPEPELDEEGNPVPRKRGRKSAAAAGVDADGEDGKNEGGSAPRRSARAPKPVRRVDAAEEGDEDAEGEDDDQVVVQSAAPVADKRRTDEGEGGGAEGDVMDVEAPSATPTAPPPALTALAELLAAAPASGAGVAPTPSTAEDATGSQPAPATIATTQPTQDAASASSATTSLERLVAALNGAPPPEATTSRPSGSSTTVEVDTSAQQMPTGEATVSHPAVTSIDVEAQQQLDASAAETTANRQPVEKDVPIDPALLAETEGAGPSNAPPATSDVATPDPAKSSKAEEKKPMGRPRGNVSLMRRENEFMKLLNDFNGVLNPGSKEFTDAHLELLSTLAAANEPTSGLPGIRVDKRTSHTTYDSLETKGKVKQLKTIVTSSLGHSRQVRVVYLPNVEQARVQAFLEQISSHGGSSAAASRTLKWQDATVVETPTPAPEQQQQSSSRARSPLVMRNSMPHLVPEKSLPVDLLQVDKGDVDANKARSDKLFALDDDTLREVFLTEKNTLAQKYGWLPGKAARAREVHMAGLEEITKAEPRSRHVVSADQRILSSSFFFNDLRLERWLKIVSTLTHNEELTKLMETEEGKKMLMSAVPASIDVDLQIGKARSRARFLDLFEVLCDLKIVTPLRPSTAEDAPIKVAQTSPTSEHPTAFEVWSDNWRASTSRQAAPSYWKFNEQGPMYLWVISQEAPPYWKDVPVRTVDDAAAYWEEVERASIVRSTADGVMLPEGGSPTGVEINSIHLSRTLRRLSSWRAEYELSWHQKHYLRHYVDVKTGNTPVEDAEKGAEKIARIARLTSAPVDVVCDYFEKARKKALRDLERVQAKAKAAPLPRAGENIEARRERMAIANAQKENTWAELLARIHPEGPLQGSHAARVARVHTKYMHAGAADEEFWEHEIRNAMQQADMANAAALAPADRSRAVAVLAAGDFIEGLPNIPQTGRSVRELIEAQGAPVETVPKSKKSKKAKKQKEDVENQETPEKARRRHRFLWNKEFDELVEDAMVIVRSRCSDMTRIELGALDQVFPGVPRNSVRQRYTTLRAEPGKDAYLKRLEDAWVMVWLEKRNKYDTIPDPDPNSATNFDLVKHVEFLRKHVDKKPLRTNRQSDVNLPTSVSELELLYDIEDHSSAASGWDFVWTSVTEEGREKGLLQNAFYTESDIIPVDDDASEVIRIAECGLKMIYATPADRYNTERAQSLLLDLGQGPDAHQAVALAQKRLQDLGVLSKLVYDPKKPKPGRTMKISEANSNAIGGVISKDTFQDAATIDALYKQPGLDWQEWSLEATDGDLAMLVQATSAGTAQFRVDTSNAQEARPKLDWNSKKAVDNDIETSISVKIVAETPAPSDRPSPSTQPTSFVADVAERPAPMDTNDSTPHGQTEDGGPACCRLVSDGAVDCAACVRTELEETMASLSDEQRTQCTNLLEVLDEAGSGGLSKAQLAEKLYSSVAELVPILELLLDATMPPVFNVGYSLQFLVAARYIRPWTATVSLEPLSRVLPRRWLDIGGRRIPDVYEGAQRAVMSTILLRPGISQAEICWRMKLLYDAQEVLEVLRTLHDANFLYRRSKYASMNSLIAPSAEEERHAMWFVAERPWYQV
ncbi:unnamed protein product [Peniophora sp. CBMAI 1063]|nr:unnamed protein product [Peniophora sp. CBMAI 1063]